MHNRRGELINNTNLQRWHRATARQLDAQFMNEIIHGMNCSPFEAEAIRDKVHEVYASLMETTDTIKPGQLRISVIDTSVAPNTPLAQAKQCVVTLTLDAGEEDLRERQESGIIALRRHRLIPNVVRNGNPDLRPLYEFMEALHQKRQGYFITPKGSHVSSTPTGLHTIAQGAAPWV